MPSKLVSLVIPVYCNASSLPALWDRLCSLAGGNPDYRFEFVFVDDASRDGSLAVLRQFALSDNRVCVVKLTRNFGSHAAILAGMTVAKGDCVALVAADLQDPPEVIPEMLRHWGDGTQVVLAVRKDRLGDPLLTRLFASVFNHLFRRYVFHGTSPQGIGFFLVDRRVTQALICCDEKNLYLFGLILWFGYPSVSVEYDRIRRVHGRSQWTFGKKLKSSIDAFAGFSYLPLRLSSLAGVVLASLGVIYAVVIVVNRLLGNVPVPGWTALMILVLVTSGTQLVMLGVIGEYLWRTLDASRNRPSFVIEEVFDSRVSPTAVPNGTEPVPPEPGATASSDLDGKVA